MICQERLINYLRKCFWKILVSGFGHTTGGSDKFHFCSLYLSLTSTGE